MKRLTLLCAAALVLVIAGCQKTGTAPASADSTDAVAVVNGEPISAQVFDLYLQRRSGNGAVEVSPQQQAELLNQITNIELLAQAAAKAGLADKSETQAKLAIQRAQLLANLAIEQYLADHPVTEELLKAEYDKRVAQMPGQEYKARHILVKTQDEARAIIKQLDEGADFTKLAAKSIEPGAAERGGDLGWFTPDQMVGPFGDAVVALEKGQYSKEPVQTQFGWHVIRLDDTRPLTPPTLDDLKPQLESTLQQQAIADYVTQLREAGTVELKLPEAGPETEPAPATEGSATGSAETPAAEQ